MKGNARLLMVLAALCPLGLSAQGIADVIDSLKDTGCYEADLSFSVTLPQSDNDIVYQIHLSSEPAKGKRLAPCDYLTDWSFETPSGTSKGFSAYFDAHT